MPRTLVIGYGNVHRADDGVAYHIIKRLREQLGQEALDDDDTGLDTLGAQVDSVFLTQLVPELVDTLVEYERIIFVDAHVRDDAPDLDLAPVSPAYAPSAFTHHMTPAMLLALLEAIHGLQPVGYLVSIRGRDFDFRQRLSAEAEALVKPAVDSILHLIPPGGRYADTKLEDGRNGLLQTGS